MHTFFPFVSENLLVRTDFNDFYLIQLTLFFMLGTCWYLYQDRIVLSNKFFALAMIMMALSLKNGLLLTLLPLTLTYSIFYLSAKAPKIFMSFDKKADYSYGIYLCLPCTTAPDTT